MLFGCVARRQAAADQQTIQRIGLSEGADAFHYSHGGRNQPKRYVLFKTARLSHYYTRQTPCWERGRRRKVEAPSLPAVSHLFCQTEERDG